MKKTVKGVAVAGGFAIITTAAVLSIMHGVFFAVAGLSIAAAAAVSSAATFTVRTRIRSLMRSSANEIKRSI